MNVSDTERDVNLDGNAVYMFPRFHLSVRQSTLFFTSIPFL